MNLSRLLRTALFAALGLLLVGGLMPAQAQDIFVSAQDGNDATGDGSQANPFETIRKAEDEASAGDIIAIEADTYNEGGSETTIAKNLTLRITEFSGQTASNVLEVPIGLDIDADVTITAGSNITDPVLVVDDPTSQTRNISFSSGSLILSDKGLVLDGAIDTGNGTVELGSETLTLRANDTDVAIDNGGEIISDQSGTVGDGVLEIDDAGNGNNVTFANSNGDLPNVTVTSGTADLSSIGSSLTAFGTVKIDDGATFTGPGAGLTVEENFNLNGGGSGTTYTPNGELTVNGNYSQSGSSSDFDGTGAGGHNLTVKGTFTQSAGQYTSSGGVDNLQGNVSINGGDFDVNASSADVDADSDFTVSNSGTTVTANGGLGNPFDVTGGLTVNNGTFDVSGGTTLNVGGTTSITDGTLNASGGTTADLGGDFSLTGGSFDAPSGNTFTIGGGFSRANGATFNNNGGTVTFDEGGDVDFDPGGALRLENVDFNKTNAGNVVSLRGTFFLDGDLDVSQGELDLQNHNIRLDDNGASQSITVDSKYTTGLGAVILQNGETANLLGGAGTFGDLQIAGERGNTSNQTATILNSGISVSGTLTIRNGQMELDDNDDDGGTGTASDITLSDANETPTIEIADAAADIVRGAGGDIVTGANVTYNLRYTNDGDVTATDNEEFDDDKNQSINNFTDESSATLMQPSFADATIVNGVLTVQDNASPALDLNGNANLELVADGNSHSVEGELDTGGSVLDITGDNVTVSGSGNTNETNTIEDIDISGTGATINGLDVIDGNLTVNASADGSVSLFDTQEVQGTITLNNDANSLALNSAVDVTSTTTPTVDVGDNATLNLKGNDLTLTAGSGSSAELQVSGTSDNEGSVTASGGTAIFGDEDSDTPTIDANGNSIPNVQSIAGGGTPTTLASDLEVSGLLDLDDDIDVNSNTLEISGNAEVNDADGSSSFPFVFDTGNSGDINLTGASTTITSEDADGVAGGTSVSFGIAADLNVNSSGTVTFATNDLSTPSPRTFQLRDRFDHIEGDIKLGINDLELRGDTFASQSDAGSWSASASGGVDAGRVILNDNNDNGTFVSFNANGNTVSIPYLEIELSGSATEDGSDGYQLQNSGDVLTAKEQLYLTGATLDASTNGAEVQIGDGATIIRELGQLDQAPTFLGAVDNQYEDGSVSTDEELNTEVRNLTDNGGVTIDKDVTVSSTFTVTATPDIDNSTLTMGQNSTVVLDGGNLDASNGGSLSYADASSTTLNYEGTSTVNNGTLDEWPSSTALNVDVEVGSGTDLGLGDDREGQDMTFTSGDIDLASSGPNDLDVLGDVTQNSDGFFHNGNGSSQEVTVRLAGSSMQTIEINGDGELSDDDSDDVTNFELDNSAGAQITNGSVIMSNTGASLSGDTELVLTSGNLATGDNYVELDHDNTSDQGFERPSGGGTVVGNVRKVVPSTATNTNANSLQFPTGKDGSSIHRPMTITFNDPTQVSASNIRLEVNHDPSNPGGANGIDEITTTDSDGDNLDIDRYPDFHWDVEATSTLSPSVAYDVELDARQAPEFQDEDIERVRILNRADGQITNRWDLNGDGPADYNNRQPSSDRAIAVVRNSTGGLVNDPGQIFTFGLENNLEAAQIADKEVDAGASTTGPFLGSSATNTGTFSGGTGEYQYSGTVQDQAGNDVTLGVSSSDDNVATGSVNGSDELVVDGKEAGTATLTITMADGLNIIQSQTVNVDVNGGVAFVQGGELQDQTVFEFGGVNNSPFTFTYDAEDQDPNESLSDATDPYQLVNPPNNVSIDATTGELTFEPSFAQAQSSSPVTVEVQVTDNDGLSATTTADLTVEFDRVLGDVDGSGFANGSRSSDIGSGDALAVLEIAVGRTTFETGGLAGTTVNDRHLRAADCAPLADPNDASQGCGGDTPNQANRGDVNSGDALATLQVGNATSGNTNAVTASETSAKAVADASGALTIEDAQVEGNTATLPVVLSDNASNVRAADLTLDLSDLDAEVQSVTDNLPDGWMTAQNVSDGELKVGMIGQRAPTSGTVAEIKLDLSGESLPELEGQYRLNGGDTQDLDVQVVPSKFELKGNYPNPVSRSTTIEYQVSKKAPVTLEVYNTLGQKVATLVNETKEAGQYEVTLDAGSSGLSSGVYFYRLNAGNFTANKRMTVVR